MKKNKTISIVLICSLILFSLLFSTKQKEKVEKETERYQQHEVEMANGADPTLGTTGFKNNDYTVGKDFVTHLPLVVIDLEGQKIPDAYYYNAEEERFMLTDGVDPYINANIKVIDKENNVNTLSDKPDEESKILIKNRGNSSIVYEKHQYRIELLNDKGENNPLNIMGMGEESDWILNVSMIDPSLVRNYMTLNICGQFMEYTPDVRYCEVIFKNGDTYTYEGVYLMMESIKQGENRVNISDYSKKNDYMSYLVRRDRYDEEEILLNTYATKNELCYGWLGLRYPTAKDATDKVIDYVTKDISTIEKVLFSKDKDTFLTYSNYINEDTFVDYFVLNEFFTNYDAGNNSTFLYKDERGKLSVGPIWDYDNAADNMGSYMLDPTILSFEGQSWFPQLLQSETFNQKLIKRYKELRQTYFSDEYINNYIDSVTEYLGNAQKRDWSRWHDSYTTERFKLLKDSDGVVIDRNYKKYADFVQRVKDVLNEHAQYILPGLEQLMNECRYKGAYNIHTEYGIIFIAIFLAAVAIARRKT